MTSVVEAAGAAVDRWTTAHAQHLVSIRRHLHAHPELAYAEFETIEDVRANVVERHGDLVIALDDGSVILERFDGRPGTTLRGLSVSVFDRELECWRQTWVDSHGGYLDFTGGVGDDGVMELRHEKLEDGIVVPFRMRFTEVERESFVWLWERGAAEGRWNEQWRIRYTRLS